ncbi:MAG: ABC transporter permease subunit [Gammaproteobacteria bacterium]|nr:ABC transporter permease subunit [Gammaproteobacteria bacterium]
MTKPFVLAVATFISICLLWELLVSAYQISEAVFPGPVIVYGSFWQLLVDGSLLKHTVASLYRVTVGFYLAALFGIPLGIVLGRVLLAKKILYPVVQFLKPISPLAWIPLAMLWFGIGDKPAIFLIFLSCFFPLVVATSIAVGSINKVYFQVAANFNFSRTDVLFKVIVPAIIPDLVTALRLTVSIAWLVVVAAEMIAVQSGLGFLILDSRNSLRMDDVIVAMVVIGFIGLLLDYIVKQLGKGEASVWKQIP